MSSDSSSRTELFIKIAYFTSLAGASILIGFSTTLNKLRKNTPDTPEAVLFEEGSALARKALMRGTIYSVCGFGICAFASYKFFGKKLIDNFNSRAKNNDEKDIKYLQDLFGTSRESLVGESSSTQNEEQQKSSKP